MSGGSPHLVDVGGECKAKGLFCNGAAGLEPRSAECKVGLDFVTIIAEATKLVFHIVREGNENILQLLENIVDRYNDARDGRPAKHTDNGHYARFRTRHA